jgi:acyl dehydratase
MRRHADAEFARSVGFEEGPILHGLCTYGYMTRAVIRGACEGDPGRLKKLAAQFKKPVWPGERLRTLGYRLDDGRIALVAYAQGRSEAVVGSAWAEIDEAK